MKSFMRIGGLVIAANILALVRSPGHIQTPNTSKQTCLNRIFFTGPLLYVCVGFVCVQIKLFHSHSHSHIN